jgi:hypothetical protein
MAIRTIGLGDKSKPGGGKFQPTSQSWHATKTGLALEVRIVFIFLNVWEKNQKKNNIL